MIEVTTKLKDSLNEFQRQFSAALINASKQAVKATANDVIKLTLPNTIENVDKEKPASKQKGVFKSNVKRLQERIKENIMGKGIEGEDGMATAIPTADGKPVKKSIKGKSYFGIFLVAKPKGSKRRKKITNKKVKIASTEHDIISFLKRNSKIARKKVAFRKRTGSEIIWITKPATLKKAAATMAKRAGNLLSGWSALTAKAGTDTLSILSSQNVNREGSADISIKNGLVQFKASNDESHDAVSGYQQRMVDSNVPRSFKYHLENAVKNINFNSLRKSSIK